MNRFWAQRSLAVVISAATSVPALATTWYCDNDRAAAQYPHCTNLGNSSWSYHAGQSGDWNGDDRRHAPAPSGAGNVYPYTYKFTATHAYRFAAWLDNVAFTNRLTLYAGFTAGGQFTTGAVIDQLTAPGGWNGAGGSTAAWLAAGPISSTGISGADIVRATYGSSAAASDDEAAPAVSLADCDATASVSTAEDPRITAIQQTMLDAVDHYGDVAGSFTTRFDAVGQNDTVAFEVSENDRLSIVSTTGRDGRTSTSVFDGVVASSIAPDERVTRIATLSSEAIGASAEADAGPRIDTSRACAPEFVHRADPAFGLGANEVTLPQNYAFWLTSERNVRVAGTTTLLGRSATVIAGDHSAYLAAKLHATSFKMWVDDATGVLLKLEGTDAAGKSTYAIDVSRIAFDTKPDIAAHMPVAAIAASK